MIQLVKQQKATISSDTMSGSRIIFGEFKDTESSFHCADQFSNTADFELSDKTLMFRLTYSLEVF